MIQVFDAYRKKIFGIEFKVENYSVLFYDDISTDMKYLDFLSNQLTNVWMMFDKTVKHNNFMVILGINF